MSTLETSVQTLADALDRLETELEDRLSSAEVDHEALSSAHRQARIASGKLTDAGDGLSTSIKELRDLLNSTPEKSSDGDANG